MLDQPYALTSEQIAFYDEHRYIKLKQVLTEEELAHFNDVISRRVAIKRQDLAAVPLEERDTYGKAFLQLFNLWEEDEAVKELVFSARIASIATQLLQADGVRLYHDQALFKEAGGGITPWHADQYYWPLSSDKTITAWIPLQATPKEMGPLEFSAGSHRIEEGRDLAISDQSEAILQEKLRVTDFPHVIEGFEAGEVSFHSGWVFHRAGANTTDQVRKVMTVIYMDKDMKVTEPINKHQQNDLDTWMPGSPVGETVNSPLNPVLYSV
ncbi:phytanoyl-CoA dioxygenase family protein [Lewinella sp. 4G2]|uniref:phytanoyl-CoA dioxygenase family protein n=1 Tax=Lewinella sp. 4G2 TaxID=1803372 RepID=UPI0007B4ED1A|nr:phytanoyl-CoA dioxygenase family protein [Lewinella sp. 4G2]OAV43764.1 phytanoyl-CoA dioxygenase [Lewinella sp. 4G2]